MSENSEILNYSERPLEVFFINGRYLLILVYGCEVSRSPSEIRAWISIQPYLLCSDPPSTQLVVPVFLNIEIIPLILYLTVLTLLQFLYLSSAESVSASPSTCQFCARSPSCLPHNLSYFHLSGHRGRAIDFAIILPDI